MGELCELNLLNERIVTLHGVRVGDDRVSIYCTNMAGNQVCSFDVLPEWMPMRDFRAALAERMELKDFDVAKTVLLDGALLGPADDNIPISIALRLRSSEDTSNHDGARE